MATPRWARLSGLAVAAAGTMSAFAAIGAAPSSAAVAPHISGGYACTAKVPLLGTETWNGNVLIHGSSKHQAVPGQAVPFNEFQIAITIPKHLVDEAGSVGATSIGGTLLTFDISATDSTTATVNAAGAKGIALPTTPISATSPAIVVKLPAAGMQVTGWTASKDGTMTFSNGTATLQIVAVLDGKDIYVPTTCTANKAVILSHTNIV